MNAIQFIKDHGVEKAREVLKEQPAMNSARFRPSDGRHSSTFSSGNTVCTLKLRKLLESIDLIEFCGGIDIAKELDKEFLGENFQDVQQAIADYEAIYSFDIEKREFELGLAPDSDYVKGGEHV